MGKHKSVNDMVKSLSENDKFKQDTLEDLNNKGLGRFLFYLRCNHKLTQKELANKVGCSHKVGCSQARISKIEASKDEELSIKDFQDYGKVLGLQLEIGYRNKNIKYVDMVKFHAFKIQHYLKLLAELAKEDEQIETGVVDFHFEALINTNKIILESTMQLAKSRLKINKASEHTRGDVHISGPVQQLEQPV
jgi:transcriptional regulator with XRE-family HTH domain